MKQSTQPIHEASKATALHVNKTYHTDPGVPICLHENRFFRMMFNGHYHYLDPVRYANGVVMVPVFDNGDFLLVRLRRAPAIGMSLEFPRGGIESGESMTVGAIREMLEETGYVIQQDEVFRLGELASETATVNGTMSVCLVRISAGAPVSVPDQNEIDSTLRISPRELRALIASGGCLDAMSIAAMSLAMMQGMIAVPSA